MTHRKRLQFSASALFLAGALFLPAARPSDAAVVERIAIRVNDRIVTLSELEEREAEASREILRSSKGADLAEKMKLLRTRTVEEMLRELMLLERAREVNVTIEEPDVDAALERMKQQNQIKTDEELRAALAASGLEISKLRESIRRSLIIQKLIAREIQSRLDVTDEFLRTLYSNEKEKYRKPEQVRLSEILILAGDDVEERRKAKEQIEVARRRLAGGQEFSSLAKEMSQGGTREKGGDLGTVSKGELSPEIDSVVFDMPPEQLFASVESKYGHHLLRIDERFPVAYAPFEEVKEKVRNDYQDAEYEKRLTEYIAKLRTKYFVKIETGDATPK